MGKVLDLQRELWERVAQQARRLGCAGNASLSQAVTDFEASFPPQWRRIAKDRFIERMTRSDFLLVGDYHPLPRSQLVAAHFLKDFGPKTVALEVAAASRQIELDAWSLGDRPASELLSDLQFENLWGQVPTRGYEVLLETAREQGCRLLALEHADSGTAQAPAFRQREAAMIERLTGYAETPCLTLVGDLHLHPARIPSAIGAGRCTVLHQNHAAYHFDLQEQGIGMPSILQLAGNRYCYQHTHPLLVEESCLVALCGTDETHVASPEEWLPTILSRIASMFGIEAPAAPTVIATFNPDQRDLLTLLVPDKKASTRLLDRLYIQGMAFVGGSGPLIQHLPGSNHLAEAAGKWIALTRSPLPEGRLERDLELVTQLRLEAAGFLASLLVNPMRKGKKLGWYAKFLDVHLDIKLMDAFIARVRDFLDDEQDFPSPKSLPEADTPADLVLTRMLGQLIGRRLYDRMQQGGEARATAVAALFNPIASWDDLHDFLEGLRAASGQLEQPAWKGTRTPDGGE